MSARGLLLALLLPLAGCGAGARLTADRKDYTLYRETRVAGTPEQRLAASGRYLKEMPEGPVGTDDRMEYTVVGDCVNVAARLESRACPGQILVSGDTYARLNGAVHGRPLGCFSVKGKDEAVGIWELLGLAQW